MRTFPLLSCARLLAIAAALSACGPNPRFVVGTLDKDGRSITRGTSRFVPIADAPSSVHIVLTDGYLGSVTCVTTGGVTHAAQAVGEPPPSGGKPTRAADAPGAYLCSGQTYAGLVIVNRGDVSLEALLCIGTCDADESPEKYLRVIIEPWKKSEPNGHRPRKRKLPRSEGAGAGAYSGPSSTPTTSPPPPPSRRLPAPQ